MTSLKTSTIHQQRGKTSLNLFLCVSFLQAVELEPGNTFYKNNLEQVEAKLREMPSQQSSTGARGGAGGNAL